MTATLIQTIKGYIHTRKDITYTQQPLLLYRPIHLAAFNGHITVLQELLK